MDIAVHLRDGLRVDAAFKNHVVPTDQPVKAGGDDTAPAPFDLFLVSIATCAGYFVQRFCRERDIPSEEITLDMRTTRDPDTHMIGKIEIEIHLPADFPEKYDKAVMRAADTCTVKKHVEECVVFETRVTRAGD